MTDRISADFSTGFTPTIPNGDLLRFGDKGAKVAQVQELLRDAGYHIAVDGDWGPKTEAAVVDFQKKHGLMVDGIVGPKTTGKLLQVQAELVESQSGERPVAGQKQLDQQIDSLSAKHRIASGPKLDLNAELSSPNSSISIAIGCAEGTRRPDGSQTAAYGGHTDPGNFKHNRGTFSYQHAASSPEDADMKQLANFRSQVPAFEAAARKAGLDPHNPLLAASFFDLYNQAPLAATGKGGFLDRMGELAKTGVTPDTLAHMRTECYIDPKTGRYDTTFASPQALLADQKRRTGELVRVVGTGADGHVMQTKGVDAGERRVHGASAPDRIEMSPLTQHTGWTCGYTSVAMVANAVTGKKLSDNQLINKYGHTGYLPSMLNDLCKDASDPSMRKWDVGGELHGDKDWAQIEKKVHDKKPVIIGLNRPFSHTGHGHIVVITKISGNDVTYADPADGQVKHTTKQAMLAAEAHPQGKFWISTKE
jgi:hypothetical protein